MPDTAGERVSVVTKHERIFTQVRDRILAGELLPGMPLPSQAKLMGNYGVALGTVRQVLGRLQSEGWITSQRGKGSFVSKRTGQSFNTVNRSAAVGLVAFGNLGVADYNHLMAIRAALAVDHVELVVNAFAPSQVEPAAEWVQPLSGIMIWGRAPHEFLQRMIDSNYPAIMLGNMHEGDCPSQLSHIHFNLASAVDQAVQMLAHLGHRRILFVNRGGKSAATYPEYLTQLSTLVEQKIHQRIVAPTYAEMPLDAADATALTDYLNQSSLPPTALVIEGGQRTCGILHELEKAGWPAPARISAIAIGPLPTSALANAGLTYIEMPKIQLATRGAEVMLDMLRKRQIIRESISPSLHWGSTCRYVDR